MDREWSAESTTVRWPVGLKFAAAVGAVVLCVLSLSVLAGFGLMQLRSDIERLTSDDLVGIHVIGDLAAGLNVAEEAALVEQAAAGPGRATGTTMLDKPIDMKFAAVEIPDPETPVGARGIGEPPVGAGYGAVMNAIAAAYNDCMAEEWLPVSDRFRGSIIVNADDPIGAAAEIRRCARPGTRVRTWRSSRCQPSPSPPS